MFQKGIFIKQIKNCEGGDPAPIAAGAANLGLNFVAVKVAHGLFDHNTRKLPNRALLDDYIPTLREGPLSCRD